MKTIEHLAGTEGETTNQAQSPLPWHFSGPWLNPITIHEPFCIVSANSSGRPAMAGNEFDAAFIVTACNSHARNVARIAELENELVGAYSAIDANWVQHQRIVSAERKASELRAVLEKITNLFEEELAFSGNDTTNTVDAAAIEQARNALKGTK